MGSEVRAGGAYVEIYTKSKLKAGLDGARSDLKAFAGSIGALGGTLDAVSGLVIGGLVASLFAFGNAADNLTDSAARIGLTTTALQELTYAASQNGATMEDVERGLKKFQMTLGKAEKGEKSAIATFAKYGLSVSDLASLSPEEQLNRIADAIARQPDQATKAAAAMALLGKGGLQLLPMLSQGSAGLAEFAARAQALGLVIKPEDVALGGELADQWGALAQQGMVLVQTIGAALAPAMLQIIDIGQRVLAWSIRFIGANRVLVTIVAATAFAVSALGGMLLFAAGTAWLFSIALGVVNTLMTYGTFIAGVFTAAIAALSGTMGLIVLGIAVVGAALIAGIGAWLMYTKSGQMLVNGLWETVFNAVKGMGDAIMAGNIGLAWKIALNAGLIAFQQFKISVLTLWQSLTTTLVRAMMEAFEKINLGIQLGLVGINVILAKLGQRVDLSAISNASNAAKTGLNALLTAQLAKSQQAMKTEKAVLDGLKGLQKGNLDQAAKERKEFEGKFKVPEFKMPKLRMPEMITGPGSGNAGAFSAPVAAMLGQMGQITVQEKQLEKLESIAEDMDEVAAAARDGGLVFG